VRSTALITSLPAWPPITSRPGPTRQAVVARVSGQLVVAGAAREDVGTEVTEQLVVA